MTGVAAGAGGLALVVAVATGAAPAGAEPRRTPAPAAAVSAGDRPGLPADLSARLASGRSVPQTSDGVVGRVAPRVSARSGPRTITTTVREQYAIAPGLSYASFDRSDSLRGNTRGHLLVADAATPGLTLDQVGPRRVSKTATVPTMATAAGAIAAVNGDFFDIGDTGASLGIETGRATGLVKGPQSGWNSAFYVDRAGVAQVGNLAVTTKVKRFPAISVSALNPPSVGQGQVAAYDERWGSLRGYAVTDGQERRIRVVQVEGGRVVSNRTSLPKRLKVRGKVLVGRGKGATALAALRPGTRTGVSSRIAGKPPVVITGNKPLLVGGVRQVVDDVDMHPRTAVGIDRDTNRILVLVLDGRSTTSRGMTMVELAQLMRELGAEDALNLDGGGSSTLVAPDAAGQQGVRNVPSDGHLRKVANALVLDYVPSGAVPGPLPTLFPTPTPAPTPTPTPTPTRTPTPTPTPSVTPSPTPSPTGSGTPVVVRP